MLQRGLSALLLGSSTAWASSGAARAFATRAPQDYALAMKQAAEIATALPIHNKEAGLTTGAPAQVFARKAVIYTPSRTASQSGMANTVQGPAPSWKIEFDNVEKWTNPLMGWTSTGDVLENVGRASLFFYTKEEAISFADKHGWVYELLEPNPKRTTRQKRYASYGDNFSVKRKGIPDLSHLPSNRK